MDVGEMAAELIVAQIDEAQLTELVETGDEAPGDSLGGARGRRERVESLLTEATSQGGEDPLPYAWDYLQRKIGFLEREVDALQEQREATTDRTFERREANKQLAEAKRILKHTKRVAQLPLFDQVRNA